MKSGHRTDRKQPRKLRKNAFAYFKHSTKSQLAYKTVSAPVSRCQLQNKILLLQSKPQRDALSYHVAYTQDNLLRDFGTGNKAGTVQHSAIPAGMPAHADWAANTYRHLSAIELLPHAGFESSIPLYRFVALWSRRWRSAQMQTTREGSQREA